ncbi:MAG TPA: SMP-30/gluconolactonase/LRE family protein [Candidatus Acidoferrum sp.]|nr:SMP-30/gluconolactonase/LRE family protein [Candidatus Acidoferrum sp.]
MRTILQILCFASLFLSSLPAHAQDQEEIKGAPAELADAQEIRAQITVVEKLQPKFPDQGAALYFLAAAKEHLRETREALDLLKKCLALQEGFDPSGDPAFLELKELKEFNALIEDVHRDFPVAMQAREAFRTSEKDLVPEGLAYDAQRNVFYLSSLNRRKIVQIGLDGSISDFVPGDRFGLLPVLGIRLDPNTDTVWAASFKDSGQTELLHFDATGKLLGRFRPDGSAKHGFNDLVIRKNGEVILTDSLANEVLRFDPVTRSFKVLPVHRPLFYPNGIALSGDDRTLYVADSLGVVWVDLTSGQSRDVDPGPRSTLAGIDGLYWHSGRLIAIQNGIGSPRVAAFHLSGDGLRVTQTTVLENRTNFCVLPTTGAIRGSDFFFIANSQIDNMNNDKVMDVTRLEAVRVGVLHLP